eukprot:TRINITY_DN4895_c0_g1_i1.p1 TRINITY_DN4895_c0_g1~~TRINITY_DN4895_c0_g1_i1.p1  ORF type:complete len:431 (-),score=65.89 TRINITY_DN4895_c0_g1_i1:20-1312(-)
MGSKHMRMGVETEALLSSGSSEKASLLEYPNIPRDNYNLAFIIFVILGTGLLLPWNAFICANPYFTTLYSNTFVFYLSLAYNWSSVICLILSVKFMPRFSFSGRVFTFFGLDFVVLMLVPFIYNIMGEHKQPAMAATLLCVFLTGVASSILIGTIIGLASLFPPQYIGAIMTGNGVAGILTSLLSIITTLTFPDTFQGQKEIGIVYFMISAFVIVICVMGYLVLQKLPITKYYLRKFEQDKLTQSSKVNDAYGGNGSGSVSSIAVFRKVWREALCVWFVFFVSLSLFPSLTSMATVSTSLSAQWFSILFTATFMVGDFIGRSLPKWVIIFSPKNLWIPIVLRVGFFPLFLFYIKPHILDDQTLAFIIMFFFSLTNGYCGTLAMMFGPTSADNHEKETAGFIMSFMLNFGIFVAVHGALLSLYLLRGCVIC